MNVLSSVLIALLVALFSVVLLPYICRTRYEIQSGGHIVIITHRDIPAVRHAANILADKGLHILVCVPSKDMVHYMSQGSIKGVELLETNIEEPAHIARLVYRSREIVRDLDRPLTGIIMLYPDGLVTPKQSFNSTLESIEAVLQMKRMEKSWFKAFLAPMRLIQGLLPLLADPEENGGRLLLLQPAQYLLPSLRYEDHTAHTAFFSTLEALRADFFASTNISLSVVSSTTAALASTEITSDATKTLVHAMLAPHPRPAYFIGAVSILKYSKYLKLKLPLWVWKQLSDVLPPAWLDVIQGAPKAKTLATRHKKKVRKSHKSPRKQRKKINPASTYEHLAMKFGM